MKTNHEAIAPKALYNNTAHIQIKLALLPLGIILCHN